MLIPFHAPATALSLAYIGATQDTTDTNVYTFTGAGIGTASSGRHVVVCAGGDSGASRSVSGVTIGGAAMTEVVKANQGNSAAGMYIKQVAAGTTADIVVTFSGAMTRAEIVVYTITDPTSATAYDSASAVASANQASANINYVAGGAVIGFATLEENSSCSWTNLTERVDHTLETNTTVTSASKATTSAATAEAITATFANSNDVILLVGSWQ